MVRPAPIRPASHNGPTAPVPRWQCGKERRHAALRTLSPDAQVQRHGGAPGADHRGGAGTGISAKCEEAAGIDLIVIYNSGRYRMAGRASSAGLLAYGNANDIVVDMAGEVLPVCKTTPVLAGVNGTDPFVIMPVFLKKLKELGFSGVQNFPTVGIIDGTFRQSLEEKPASTSRPKST